MTEKKKPERMCVACREHKSKNELMRVVRDTDGTVRNDTTLKADGRGAYVCKSRKCIETAEKRNLFSRAFKTRVDLEIYAELLRSVDYKEGV